MSTLETVKSVMARITHCNEDDIQPESLLKDIKADSLHWVQILVGIESAIDVEIDFDKMKDGVFIVNTARGKVIDEEELLSALDSGKVAAAALDVYVGEPKPNERLLGHDRISLSPHVGGLTKEAQARIGQEAVEIIEEQIGIDEYYMGA